MKSILQASGQSSMVRFFSHGAILAGVVLVGILLMLTGCYIGITEGGDSPAWSPDGRKIAFVFSVYDRGNKSDIWVIDADGSHPKNLTNIARLHFCDEPDWSPDGSRIAYISDVGGSFDIWAMDSDGNNQVNLTNSPAADYAPAWSPDGMKIAFSSYPEGSDLPEIWTVDADGNNMKKLIGPVADRHPAQPPHPFWSPDGRKIVFTYDVFDQGKGNTFDIWVMNVDGSNLTILLKNAQSPSWSPDGSKIVCVSGQEGKNDVWAINANGSNPTRLTDNGASGNPVWSIDGSKIFFLLFTSPGAHGDIWVMNADGTDAKNLNHAGVVSPVWSPDRSHIAFVSSTRSLSLFRAGRIDIWVMNADGSSPTMLTAMD